MDNGTPRRRRRYQGDRKVSNTPYPASYTEDRSDSQYKNDSYIDDQRDAIVWAYQENPYQQENRQLRAVEMDDAYTKPRPVSYTNVPKKKRKSLFIKVVSIFGALLFTSIAIYVSVNIFLWRGINKGLSTVKDVAIEAATIVDEIGEHLSGNSILTQTSVVQYQQIFDEYSEKIKTETPILIEEYKKLASESNGEIGELARISNETIIKLAQISLEGVEKLAQHMFVINGPYSEYEEWASKLQDVYLNEGQKITAAYMDSAT